MFNESLHNTSLSRGEWAEMFNEVDPRYTQALPGGDKYGNMWRFMQVS